jgi:hypothetical protein
VYPRRVSVRRRDWKVLFVVLTKGGGGSREGKIVLGGTYILFGTASSCHRVFAKSRLDERVMVWQEERERD